MNATVGHLYLAQIQQLDAWELAARQTLLIERLREMQIEREQIEAELGYISDRHETDESVQIPD